MTNILHLPTGAARQDRTEAKQRRKIAIHLGIDPATVSYTKDADLLELIRKHEAERLKLVHNVREVRYPTTYTPAPAGFGGFDGPGAA